MPQTPIPNIQSWPLGEVGDDGQLTWAKDDQSVRETMLNILLTSPGERLQQPDFGAGLLNFIHQPNNETTRNLIAGVIRKSLNLWEQRVIIDGVDVLASPDNRAEVHINIRYRMRHQPSPAEFGLTLNLGA